MFTSNLRQKFYEHKDHLGNVRMTFSDMKNRTATGIFYLDSLTVYDYYPNGMLKPDRYYEDAWSRYGFNSMEKDDDIKGKGNSYDFGARVYDPRTVRWNSLDPLANDYPALSGYSYCGGNPIAFKDPDGKKLIDANGNVILTENKKLPSQRFVDGSMGMIVDYKPVYMYANNGTKVDALVITHYVGLGQHGEALLYYHEEASFDCHGHSKGNGVVWIDPEPVRKLIEEDGNYQISDLTISDIKDAKPGDIALFVNYEDKKLVINHSATVNEDLTLTSKNGKDILNTSISIEELEKLYNPSIILFVSPVEDIQLNTLKKQGKDGYAYYTKKEVEKALKKYNENLKPKSDGDTNCNENTDSNTNTNNSNTNDNNKNSEEPK